MAPFNTSDAVHSPKHAELALEAARQSIVLVQNPGILPLTGRNGGLAVVGPSSNLTDVFLGDYTLD